MSAAKSTTKKTPDASKTGARASSTTGTKKGADVKKEAIKKTPVSKQPTTGKEKKTEDSKKGGKTK